jgi:hypothetical protein
MDMPNSEPILTGAQARRMLAQMKGAKMIALDTLTRLVAQDGFPAHPDPFGGPRRVFLASEIRAWFRARMGGQDPGT